MIGLTNGKDPPRRTGFSERKDHRIACQHRFPSSPLHRSGDSASDSSRHPDAFIRRITLDQIIVNIESSVFLRGAGEGRGGGRCVEKWE